ncbi:MAG: trypsin-like peptidase domain-containing protein, partial [Oscillospiraceae bacterium]|nr:trypsin-like peptidase domain-containing protein [Oscillospiraceae bacterium]
MLETTDSEEYSESSSIVTDGESSAVAESVSHSLPIKDHAQVEQTASADGRLTTVEIAKKVRPSVVGIAQYSRSDTFSPSGQGSGIIINEEGYIVTNAHVVQDSAGISVELESGESYSAKLIGIDTKTDLAVI